MALPKFIVIKSIKNNKYLRFISPNESPSESDAQFYGFLQFSAEEAMSPFTKFEVEPAKSGDGLVHLKCCYNNKYIERWSKNINWVLAAAADEPKEDRSNSSCTLFQPIIISNEAKTFRFVHVQWGRYLTAKAPVVTVGISRGQEYWLSAESYDPDDLELFDVFTITDWASIGPPTQLNDPKAITSREIYDVKYQFLDAKLSDQKAETLATATINNTTLESNIVAIELTYPNTKTSTWSSSNAFSTVTLKANIPTIVAGLVENSTVFEGQYEWGKTKDFSNKVKLVFNTIVPRKTKLTLNLVGTLGSYDIPFSYTQCDTHTNGNQVVREMGDGTYRRVNIFKLKYETKQEPAVMA